MEQDRYLCWNWFTLSGYLSAYLSTVTLSFYSKWRKTFINLTLLFSVILGVTSNWVSSKIPNPSMELKTQFSCGIIINWLVLVHLHWKRLKHFVGVFHLFFASNHLSYFDLTQSMPKRIKFIVKSFWQSAIQYGTRYSIWYLSGGPKSHCRGKRVVP